VTLIQSSPKCKYKTLFCASSKHNYPSRFCSLPLFAVLSVRKPWKTILRKFGQVLFGASPARETSMLEDVIKTWKNRAHFRNHFLTYAKTRTKQNPPPLDTAYGIQRLSILFGFSYFSAMLDVFQRLEKEKLKKLSN
jgi:hypothetical protein